jgi:hypothetical protein
MFARLIESKRVRDRSAGGTVASVLAHSGVIGLLAYATLGAAPVAPIPDPDPPRIVYMPVSVVTHTSAPSSCDACVHLPGPAYIEVPELGALPGPAIEPVCVDCTAAVEPRYPPPGFMVAPTDSEGVFETVEQPARALAGNPHPDYPSLLRSANVTGQVSARFVVDTLGRVEQGSIAFEPGSDVLFESSVRRALLASRYAPAMTSGRRVRMLVRQDFAFRLTP